MAVYLVRTIDDHDLVGIFSAPDLEELIFAVDECTDPTDCEYQRMGTGGIIKAAAEAAAKDDTRSLSSYVEKIITDHLRKGGYLKK